MTPTAKKAYRTWIDQRSRCYCKTHRAYKWYGKKGIKVEYNSRDFIGWYLDKLDNFSGKRPSVGRIDHSKNYAFDNIEVVTAKENAQEVSIRTKLGYHNKRAVDVYRYTGMSFLKKFDSLSDAGRSLGMTVDRICLVLNGKNRRSGDYFFKYSE